MNSVGTRASPAFWRAVQRARRPRSRKTLRAAENNRPPETLNAKNCELLDLELLRLFFLFDLELDVFVVGEKDCFLVRLRLDHIDLFAGLRILLLAALRLVLARAHLRRLS